MIQDLYNFILTRILTDCVRRHDFLSRRVFVNLFNSRVYMYACHRWAPTSSLSSSSLSSFEMRYFVESFRGRSCLGITRGCRSALEDARWSRGSEYFGVRSLPLFPPAKLSRGSLRKARSGFRRAGERLAVEIEREATREDENRAIRARYA